MGGVKINNLKAGILPALTGVIAPPLFLLLSCIAAGLHPGYSSIRHTISELALGPYGWIQTVNFFITGILIIIFSYGLYFGVRQIRCFRAGIGLLIAAGVAAFLLGLFPTELEADPTLITSSTHLIIAAVVFGLFPLAFLLIAPSLKADPSWNNLFLYTVITGILGLCLFFGVAGLSGDWEFFGLYERGMVANGFIWIEVIAIRLLRSRRKYVIH